MKNITTNHSKAKQAFLPLFISDFLDICDPVLVFDRFMEGIDLEKYLRNVPEHVTGRIRYNPTSMVKTVLFGFMTNGYISLREEVVENLESIHGALLRMNRSIQSEGTFGILKNNRWYKRIVRKGMGQVRLEIFLVSIGYNLYKYHNKTLRIKKAA